MNENLIEEIKALGLNSYEAKVYLALLERQSLSVSEISKISRVPRARTYDILDALVTQGLATLKPGQVKKYGAADPDSLREKLMVRSEKNYSYQKQAIEKVTLSLKRKFESTLNDSTHRTDPLEYIEIIREPHQIHKKFVELIGEARREILIFTKPPYTGPKEVLAEQTEKQSEPLRSGVTIKSIYEIPTDKEEFEWWYQDIVSAVSLGEKARVIKELPMKMAVFDETVVMLPLEDPILSGTSFTAQIIRHPALARTLKITFETLWEQAEDYRVVEGLVYKK